MFRKEAIAAKRQKLHGGVFLIQPLSFPALGLLILSIASFSVILLLTGSYARSENVIGHLVPSKGLVKIQAARFGTLASIYVREGDKIESGQKLATIKVSNNALDGASFADKALAALARQDFELQTLITLETNQLETELAHLKTEKEEIEISLGSLKEQLGFQRQLATSAQDAFKAVKNLRVRGYISKEESEHRRQEWLRQKTQEQFREREVAAAESKQKLLEIRLLQLPNESNQRIARLKAQKAELEGRKSDLSGRSAYAVTSSVAGKVVSLSVSSIGRSIQAGQPLLTVMPEDSLLGAELFIPSRAIGFVEKGQEVRLLYDAFPYQFFGSYKATITDVTEIILAPNEILASLDLRESVYRVTARIEDSTIKTGTKEIALQSGMTLRANIVLERRSFLDWLLEPIHALRERS